MIQIENLNHETLCDIAGFCMNQLKLETGNSTGDKNRIHEACKRRQNYLINKLEKGVRAKIAYQNGNIVGFIEYYPIEIANLEISGKDIMVIWCINIAEEERGKGIGTQLLQACLADSRQLTRKGVAVTCWDPVWMPSEFFKKHGFNKVGNAVGNGIVLFKQFESVEVPKWIGRGGTYEKVKFVKGKIVIDIFHNNRCPIHWWNTDLVKKVGAEFKDKILVKEYNIDDRKDMLEHKIAYSVYMNGKVIAAGPLATEIEIRKKIRVQLRKL